MTYDEWYKVALVSGYLDSASEVNYNARPKLFQYNLDKARGCHDIDRIIDIFVKYKYNMVQQMNIISSIVGIEKNDYIVDVIVPIIEMVNNIKPDYVPQSVWNTFVTDDICWKVRYRDLFNDHKEYFRVFNAEKFISALVYGISEESKRFNLLTTVFCKYTHVYNDIIFCNIDNLLDSCMTMYNRAINTCRDDFLDMSSYRTAYRDKYSLTRLIPLESQCGLGIDKHTVMNVAYGDVALDTKVPCLYKDKLINWFIRGVLTNTDIEMVLRRVCCDFNDYIIINSGGDIVKKKYESDQLVHSNEVAAEVTKELNKLDRKDCIALVPFVYTDTHSFWGLGEFEYDQYFMTCTWRAREIIERDSEILRGIKYRQ